MVLKEVMHRKKVGECDKCEVHTRVHTLSHTVLGYCVGRMGVGEMAGAALILNIARAQCAMPRAGERIVAFAAGMGRGGFGTLVFVGPSAGAPSLGIESFHLLPQSAHLGTVNTCPSGDIGIGCVASDGIGHSRIVSERVDWPSLFERECS